jgi:hypothetical protein
MGGGGDSADLGEALGHWAEADVFTYNPERMSDGAMRRKLEAAGADNIEERLAANRIHSHYMVNSEREFGELGKKILPEDTELDLSNPDARLQALDNFTQNMAGNKNAESQCVASSLVAAAVLGGGEQGNEGILKLMHAMEANAKAKAEAGGDGTLDCAETLKTMRERIKEGQPLTIGDLHQLQQDLYSQLKKDQLQTQTGNAADATAGGINAKTVQKFMANSDGFDTMMEENKLEVVMINNNGMQNSPHAVLQIGRGDDLNPAIFDPQFRDEGQIIASEQETADYQLAKMKDMS